MPNELVQGLLQDLLRPQKGPAPADIMAAISAQNPMAAVAAMQAPQLGQMFGQQFRGLIGGLRGQPAPLTADEAMAAAIRQIAAQPDLMNSSVGLNQLAKAASTVGRTAEAMQFSLMASQRKAEEEAKEKADAAERAAVAKAQLQIGTVVSSLDELAASTTNEDAKAEILALRNPAASGALTPNQIRVQIENIMKRYDIDPLKADVKNFQFPAGQVLALRENEEGNVFYNGSWQDPSSLEIIEAPSISISKGTTGEPSEVVARRADSLISWAAQMRYLPEGDLNDPISRSFIDAVQSGIVKDTEAATKWFETLPGSPAYETKLATIKNNALATLAPTLRNLQEVTTILDTPGIDVGSAWSLTEDYPLGTDAARLNQALAPIISDAALSQIASLKQQAAEMGGQGTGLGAITSIEFDALTNRIENFATSRTLGDLQDAVADYNLHLINIRNLNSGRRPIIVEGDPAYEGLIETDTNTGESFLNLNGVLTPVVRLKTVADALVYASDQRVNE